MTKTGIYKDNPCIECKRLLYKQSKSDLCLMCKRKFCFSIGKRMNASVNLI